MGFDATMLRDDLASTSDPAKGAAMVGWKSAETGGVARTVATKLSDTVDVRDFGTGSTAFDDALASGTFVNISGTMTFADAIEMTDYTGIFGGGQRTTDLTYSGSGVAFSSPVASGPSYPKTFYQVLKDFRVKAGTTNVGTGIRWVHTGPTYTTRVEPWYFDIGIELRGSVNGSIDRSTIQGCNVGLLAGGFSSIESTTHTSVTNSVITVCDTAIKAQGTSGNCFLKGLHFSDVDIESNTNVFDADGTLVNNLVFRNCWFEDNDTFDLEGCISPVIDTGYFTGSAEVTNGIAPVLRNIHVTGSTNVPTVSTTSDAAFVSATTHNWTDSGTHGLNLTMPKIGSASTPVDLYSPSECSQSALIGSLAGTLFGYSQPAQNLIGTPVSQTAYNPAGFWPYGGATVATGQADMFGGTTAVKLSGASQHGCVAVPTVAGQWYVLQLAFSMVAATERVGLTVVSQTANLLAKTVSFSVPDTSVRVIYLRYKAPDSAGMQIYIDLPASGVVVHRVGVFSGAELKPFIPEGANIPLPFLMTFGTVESRGSAAPTTGTWRVGDRVLRTAPAAGGSIGWVCTTAGTPGTWKTFGAIAA